MRAALLLALVLGASAKLNLAKLAPFNALKSPTAEHDARQLSECTPTAENDACGFCAEGGTFGSEPRAPDTGPTIPV